MSADVYGSDAPPGYHYYVWQGRTDALRAARGDRCTAHYAPAHVLDECVWQDLCRVLREPALITHELARAQLGAWLPQALQARRQTLRDVLAQLERQQARLLALLYLAEVIERAEFERKRKEVTQTQQSLTQQLRQLDAQAQQHVNVAALAQGIEAFCQRLHPTLNNLTLAQRRQLVALLIDRVIVNDAQVEIRYVAPTGSKGETTPFCHLRLDYLDAQALLIQAIRLLSYGHRADHIQRLLIPLGPTTQHHDWTIGISGAIDVLYFDQPACFETRSQGIESKRLTIPRRRCAHGHEAHIEPTHRVQRALQIRPIALAVAQQDPLSPLGDQRAPQRDDSKVDGRGTMLFGTVAHAPRQGQLAPLIDHVKYQRHAATPDATAIHDHHPRL